MQPRFRVEHMVDSERIDQALDDALRRGEGHVVEERGSGFDSQGKPDFARRYEIGCAGHATLETARATARLADGRLALWLATQAPERARQIGRASSRARVGQSVEIWVA